VTKTLIFIPTYNERDNVVRMCEEILAVDARVDLLFVDDDSPDGTGDVLDELAAKHPRVRVQHRSGKLGIGSAHLAGIAYAYDHGYGRLLTMDCDFTHSPTLIPEMLTRSKKAHVVVGSRYVAAGSLDDWGMLRKVLTVGGHFLTKQLLGITEDATSAFRAYDLTTIPRETFDLVLSRGYSFFFESLLVLKENGFSVDEAAATLSRRTHGQSKMTIQEVRRSVETLVTLYLAKRTHPDRFRVARRPSSGRERRAQSGLS
jgi:dolichol-phosphate mannosyltransferase